MEEFYRGKTIFMTGATGFLGKVILEKILWDLAHVRTVYILVRKKKGVAAQDRLSRELLSSRVWERLRARHGAAFDAFVNEKVRCVHGDIAAEGLEMPKQDYDMLCNEVDVIIHGAATITFTDPLADALQINTLGTMRILDLAKRCKRLCALHHVSTCYVGCKFPAGTVITETISPMSRDPEQLLKSLLSMSRDELERKTPELLGSYPNTYTFTKALAEELLAKRRGTMPIVILRPSIIGAAWKEPIGGWIDTISAAAVIYVAVGVGLVKMLQGDIRGIGDQVPVDMVVNAILVSTFAVANQDRLEIYQVGTSSRNPLKWTVVAHTMAAYWDAHPPSRRIGNVEFWLIRNPYIFATLYYMRFKMPVQVFRGLSTLLPKSQTLKQNAELLEKLETRHTKISETFTYFMTNQWIYEVSNLDRLFSRLSERDREKFFCDMTSIEWPLYLEQFGWGILTIVMKERITHPTEDRERPVPNIKKGLFPDVSWVLRYGPRNQPIIDDSLHSAILQSSRVQQAMRQLAAEKQQPIAVSEAQVVDILNRMSGNISMVVVKLLGWFFRKIYRHLYQSIIIDFMGLQKVWETSPNIPLVLVPTHKSYVDFLVISYVCYCYRLPLPHIAAGDDFLNILIVNWLFRRSGAFFMRRSFEGDQLYRAVFSEYVSRLVIQGFPLEFFIEGQRSRTGKPLSPKMGLLKIVSDTYFDGQVPDLCLVPMPISYDKVIEDEQHVRELLGEEKPRLSLTGLVTSGYNRVRSRNFGRIQIQFGTPISVREYTAQYLRHRISGSAPTLAAAAAAAAASPSLSFDPFKSHEDRKVLVSDLAFVLMDELRKNEMMMSTNLVAAIVLSEKRVVSKELLVARYIWLRHELHSRGGRVDSIEGDAPQAVDHALRLLNDCLDIRRNIVEPSITQRKDYKHIAQLGYYSNALVPTFFFEGILAVALAAFGDRLYPSTTSAAAPVPSAATASTTHTGGVPLEELLPELMFLRRLLVLEANDNSPPAHDSERLTAELARMCARGILARTSNGHICLPESGERIFSFICSLIWPFVDSYWTACFTLLSLAVAKQSTARNGPPPPPYSALWNKPLPPPVPFARARALLTAQKKPAAATGPAAPASAANASASTSAAAQENTKGISEAQFIERVQWVAEKFYFDGILGHFQSCSRPTLYQALRQYQSMGIVSIGANKLMTITAEYQADNGARLKELCRKIGWFKNVKEDVKRDIYRTLHEDFPILTSKI